MRATTMSTAATPSPLTPPAASPPPPSTSPTTQAYYDRFSTTYEAERHHGYHRLIDELELDLVRQYGAGRDVFEAGCGTGLLLRETARLARSAIGLDLSRGMLAAARDRALR